MPALSMTVLRRVFASLWLLVPVAALAWLVGATLARVGHIEYVSGLAGGDALPLDAATPTGLEGGVRRLVAPEHDARSLQWIVQAQEMAAQGTWQLDRVTYDNAPAGRPVDTPALYRGWLAGVGWVGAQLTGQPTAAAIERAALWADPWLHILLLAGVVAVLGGGWGRRAAAWGALVAVGAFPWAGTLLPGRPDESGLAVALAVFSLLLVVRAAAVPPEGRQRLWMALAGLAGGLGLAVSVPVQGLVLTGLCAGGIVGAWRQVANGSAAPASGPWTPGAWRAWAWTGGLVAAVAWWAETPADRLAWTTGLDRNHPLYALAWFGAGEWLAFAARARLDRPALRRLRTWIRPAAAAGALALLPLAWLRTGQTGFASAAETLGRISDLPGQTPAASFPGWLAERGLSGASLAAVLPILFGVVLLLLLVRRARRVDVWVMLLPALGAVTAALGASAFWPGAWTLATGLLLAWVGPLVVGCAAPEVPRWLGGAAAGCALLPLGLGMHAVAPREATGAGQSVSPAEVRALVERDLAWWLARQAPEPGAIVLAPPELTAGLIYYGGLRGLGTPYRENSDGFRVSVRLAAASPAEGEALARNRGVRYIVMPSWDPFLDEYARLGSNQPEFALVGLLHRWQPPRWLRPVPYLIPRVEGLMDATVEIFEVVEVQDNGTALSHLAQFFVETGRLHPAGQLAAVLKEQFPGEPAAGVARAQVAWARRNAVEFREAVAALKRLIEDGATEVLAWDQRVNLALVLAQARETELARAEAERCLDEMDATLPRTLTNLRLREFLILLDTLGLEMADPEVKRAALEVLPRELRGP